jgi:hypothetical protein
MSKRCAVFAIGAILALAGCEKRDVDGDEPAAETTEDATTAPEAEDSDDDASGDEASKSDSDEPATDDQDDQTREKAEPVEPAAEAASWETCSDGAARVMTCAFEPDGGATLCSSTDFVELRLARPDGSTSVHRHRAGEAASVEKCGYSSPQRVDESVTFYERGQRLMVESHYINPESDYAKDASGETEWSVSVAATDGDKTTWSCVDPESDGLGPLDQSNAVALRPGSGDTCDSMLEPSVAKTRRAKLSPTASRCGGEQTSDEFIDAAARATSDKLRYRAAGSLAADDVEYTSIRLASSSGGAESAVASCDSFFERVRAATEDRTVGAPPFQVGVDFGLLRYDGHRVFDAATEVCVDFCNQKGAIEGDFVDTSYEGLSLVGPILSYETTSESSAAGAKATQRAGWGALDLRTMQPASFGALIDTQSALAALKKDTYVRRHDTLSERVAAAESFDDALAAMRAELDGVEGYAFHYYNPRTGLVAMRIPFRQQTADAQTYSMSQIGIWAKPKAQWLPAFEAARNAPDGGFYMTNYSLTF